MNRKLFYLSYLGYIGLLLAEAQKSLLRHVLTNETDLLTVFPTGTVFGYTRAQRTGSSTELTCPKAYRMFSDAAFRLLRVY